MKYDVHYNTSRYYHNESTNTNDRRLGHLNSATHLQKQERLEFFSS